MTRTLTQANGVKLSIITGPGRRKQSQVRRFAAALPRGGTPQIERLSYGPVDNIEVWLADNPGETGHLELPDGYEVESTWVGSDGSVCLDVTQTGGDL